MERWREDPEAHLLLDRCQCFPAFSNWQISDIVSGMVDLLIQFAVEIVRALLVDELSERVRGRAKGWFLRHGAGNCRKVIVRMHLRNRDRLLNRLLTEIG
jgi:hypothetical protein